MLGPWGSRRLLGVGPGSLQFPSSLPFSLLRFFFSVRIILSSFRKSLPSRLLRTFETPFFPSQTLCRLRLSPHFVSAGVFPTLPLPGFVGLPGLTPLSFLLLDPRSFFSLRCGWGELLGQARCALLGGFAPQATLLFLPRLAS